MLTIPITSTDTRRLFWQGTPLFVILDDVRKADRTSFLFNKKYDNFYRDRKHLKVWTRPLVRAMFSGVAEFTPLPEPFPYTDTVTMSVPPEGTVVDYFLLECDDPQWTRYFSLGDGEFKRHHTRLDRIIERRKRRKKIAFEYSRLKMKDLGLKLERGYAV